MIRKLAHLCLVTDQLDTMLDFYTRGLGFSIQFTFKNPAGEVFGHYLSTGDSTFIEIFDRVRKAKMWGPKDKEPAALAIGTQIQHFCFEVTGLAGLKPELEARGVTIGPIKTGMDFSLQMWTADPDGNPIEFMEYTYASWQLRAPAELTTAK